MPDSTTLREGSSVYFAVADGSNKSNSDTNDPIKGTSTRPLRDSETVGVDYFDPVGVEELRRVLTKRSSHDLRRSVTQTTRVIPEVHSLQAQEKQDPTSIASSTSPTLMGLKVKDGLDLEKTLRHIVGT
jgi:ATP-binding cassette subfamily G (WHITE) protein 2 (SNQ2)